MQRELKTAIAIDPHPLWLDALEQVLSAVPLRIAARVSTLDEGLEPIERLLPDVVIAEIAAATDPSDGLAWVRHVREHTATQVIVFTTYDDRAYIRSTLAAGATAYVSKTAHPDDLIATVRQAFEPSIYFAASDRGIEQHQPPPSASQGTSQTLQRLTRRELEILKLAAEGHSNARLAKMLWVTEQTVKFHLSNIYRKIGVANRTEAGRWAQVHGLLQQDGENPTQVA